MSTTLAFCIMFGVTSAIFAVRVNTAAGFLFFTIVAAACLTAAVDLILKALS